LAGLALGMVVIDDTLELTKKKKGFVRGAGMTGSRCISCL
jgi:hypothetical protein